jgi:hypothetical protein
MKLSKMSSDERSSNCDDLPKDLDLKHRKDRQIIVSERSTHGEKEGVTKIPKRTSISSTFHRGALSRSNTHTAYLSPLLMTLLSL